MESKQSKIIYIGSDHAGFELKKILHKHLALKGYQIEDVGPFSADRCDYPDYATKLCKELVKTQDQGSLGILVCGSGVGISIAANKHKDIRCALCHDYYTALMSKTKDHCNVIAIGGRVTGPEVAKNCVDTFIEAEYDNDPAYKIRVEKLKEIENQYLKE